MVNSYLTVKCLGEPIPILIFYQMFIKGKSKVLIVRVKILVIYKTFYLVTTPYI